MARSLARPRKTLQDLLALPEDVRAELIDGEILVTPAPLRPHQAAAGRLFVALASRLGHVGEQLFFAPFDVVLGSGDVVQPDLFWVRSERIGIVGDRVEGAPDLIVEILSPGNPERDRCLKRDLYARNGVREYWIADPGLRGIEVFLLEGDRYRPAGWFPPGTRVVTPTVPEPGIAIEVVFPPRDETLKDPG